MSTGGGRTKADGWVLVIIESPFKGDVARNKLYLQRCIRDCIERGEAPFASHQMYTDALDDNIPEERAMGIGAGLAWRSVAEKAVFYVDYGYSGGMMQARALYEQEGIPWEVREIGLNPTAAHVIALPFEKRLAIAKVIDGESVTIYFEEHESPESLAPGDETLARLWAEYKEAEAKYQKARVPSRAELPEENTLMHIVNALQALSDRMDAAEQALEQYINLPEVQP